jgi:O-antigen ligase
LVADDYAEDLASHNVFLRFLAELGLIGFTLLALVIAGWVQRARHTISHAPDDSPERALAILFAGALCAYVAEAMFHDVTFISQDNVLIFFLAGCMGTSWAARAAWFERAHSQTVKTACK